MHTAFSGSSVHFVVRCRAPQQRVVVNELLGTSWGNNDRAALRTSDAEGVSLSGLIASRPDDRTYALDGASIRSATTRTTPLTIDLTCHGYIEATGARAYNCIPESSQQHHMRTFVPPVGSACDAGSIAEFPPGRIVFQIRCRDDDASLPSPVPDLNGTFSGVVHFNPGTLSYQLDLTLNQTPGSTTVDGTLSSVSTPDPTDDPRVVVQVTGSIRSDRITINEVSGREHLSSWEGRVLDDANVIAIDFHSRSGRIPGGELSRR